MAKIGGRAMIGELSKYQKIKATPSLNEQFTVAHTLGVVPKICIIYCSESSEPYTTEGFIQYIIADNNAMGMNYWNAVNHNISRVGGQYLETGNLTNGTYRLTATDIQIRRASANGQWSTSTEYTIELYA